MDWPPEFEAAVRRNLTALDEDAPLNADSPLVEFGLDSLGMVALVFDLESVLDVVLPDECLVPETFEKAGTLWSAVAAALKAEPAPDRRTPG